MDESSAIILGKLDAVLACGNEEPFENMLYPIPNGQVIHDHQVRELAATKKEVPIYALD